MSKNKKKTKTSNKSLTKRANDVAVATKAMVVYSEPREEYGYDCNSEYRPEGETPLLTNGDNQSYGLYIKRKEEKTKTKVHFNPAALFSGIGGSILSVLIGGAMAMLSNFLPDLLGGIQPDDAPAAATSVNSMLATWSQHICMILGVLICIIGIFKLASSIMRGSYDGESLFWTEKVKAKPKEKLEQFKVKMPNELSQDLLEEPVKQ